MFTESQGKKVQLIFSYEIINWAINLQSTNDSSVPLHCMITTLIAFALLFLIQVDSV